MINKKKCQIINIIIINHSKTKFFLITYITIALLSIKSIRHKKRSINSNASKYLVRDKSEKPSLYIHTFGNIGQVRRIKFEYSGMGCPHVAHTKREGTFTPPFLHFHFHFQKFPSALPYLLL